MRIVADARVDGRGLFRRWGDLALGQEVAPDADAASRVKTGVTRRGGCGRGGGGAAGAGGADDGGGLGGALEVFKFLREIKIRVVQGSDLNLMLSHRHAARIYTYTQGTLIYTEVNKICRNKVESR